jgi:hypothetical protein
MATNVSEPWPRRAPRVAIRALGELVNRCGEVRNGRSVCASPEVSSSRRSASRNETALRTDVITRRRIYLSRSKRHPGVGSTASRSGCIVCLSHRPSVQ